MKWIRLEATSGLRIMAPSFSPPPSMEGIDKLFDHPIHARTFHCFRESLIPLNGNNNKNKNNSGFGCTEEMLVLLQRQALGGKLGEVTIAVGGTEVSQAELDVLLECAFEAVMRTNNNGVRMIFDMLCTSSLPSLSSLRSFTITTTSTTSSMKPSLFVPDEVVEYDGLPTGKNTNGGEGRRVGEWREKDGIITCKRNKKSLEARRAAFLRRKALLYFVAQDVVPVSLLHCRVSRGTKSYGCTSSVADAVHSSPKDIQSLAISATYACKCLLDVVNRTLTTAYSSDDGNHKQLRQIWSSGCDKPPFIAAFSTSGILFASPSFFRLTDHRDRLFISGLAIDQLCRWSVEERQGPRVKTSLVHIHDVLLKCKRSGVLLNILFISIGSAVSCVFGFFFSGDANEGVLWGAATLRQFVEKHLITPRTSVTIGIREHGDKSDSDDTDMDGELDESVISFTPHLLLCMASLHPTPWFYQILYEMQKVEQEATRDTLFGIHEEPETSQTMPSKPRGRCHYFSLFSNCGKKKSSSVATRPFVWYTDTVDLPLDLAWCVAASHIIKAESSIGTEGRELGQYALFSMISPAAADSTLVVVVPPTVDNNEGGGGDVRRYAASWFQHCWRHTCFTDGNRKDENDNHGYYYNSGNNISEPDPTRLLQGLSSVGGGPRISLHYEMREKGGYLFHRKNKYEAHTDDDTPAFTSQTTVFPFSLLMDENEAESFILSDTVKESKTMTAFYALGLQKMKGTTHDAVVQEMLLMEGDQIEHEGDVTTMLQKRNVSLSSGDAFAACHQVTRHVLEDVWRYPCS